MLCSADERRVVTEAREQDRRSAQGLHRRLGESLHNSIMPEMTAVDNRTREDDAVGIEHAAYPCDDRAQGVAGELLRGDGVPVVQLGG